MLPPPQEASLEVYNVLGSKITSLVSGKLSEGEHTVSWDATDLASGIYLCRIKAGDFTAISKMVLLK